MGNDAWRWVQRSVRPATSFLGILLILAYMQRAQLDLLLQPKTSLAWRAILCVFYHKKGLHLLVNCLWTFHIGGQLERQHGSWSFLGSTTLMIFLSQGVTLLIYFPYVFIMVKWFDTTICSPYLERLTSGFSGPLFALHFLLMASNLCYSIRDGILLSHCHHGYLIESLVLLAVLQSFIVPDAHFLSCLWGIFAGFLHISAPPLLLVAMAWLKSLYVRALEPMYHALCERFVNLYQHPIEVEDDHHPQYPQTSQPRSNIYTNRQTQYTCPDEDSDEDMDLSLQWECWRCSSRNGVFLYLCLVCKEERICEWEGPISSSSFP